MNGGETKFCSFHDTRFVPVVSLDIVFNQKIPIMKDQFALFQRKNMHFSLLTLRTYNNSKKVRYLQRKRA